MSPKLPTVMRAAEVRPNERDYDRPLAHVDALGQVFVELPCGVIVRVSEEYGESYVTTQFRLAPDSSAELLTRNEAATELANLLENVAMSKTARATVDQVINKYGKRRM
jgi:hypothetical protein